MAGPLEPLTLALAQVDPRVGDLEGNARLVRENIAAARDAGAELVLFGELVLTGYPPEDLLLKEHFLQAAQETLDAIAREVGDRLADGVEEVLLQQQVLGWIAADGELGEQHQLGAGVARLRDPLGDLGGVAFEVADGGVDLGERQAERGDHAGHFQLLW